MQDYLIVKGQIDPIETENALEGYKPPEWTKLDRIVYATIQMHLFETVYYTMQSLYGLLYRHIRKEDERHKGLSNSEPLQSSYERTRFGPDTTERRQKHQFPNFDTRDDYQ